MSELNPYEVVWRTTQGIPDVGGDRIGPQARRVAEYLGRMVCDAGDIGHQDS